MGYHVRFTVESKVFFTGNRRRFRKLLGSARLKAFIDRNKRALLFLALFLGLPLAVGFLTYFYSRGEIVNFYEQVFNAGERITFERASRLRKMIPVFIAHIAIASSILIINWKIIKASLHREYWKDLSGSIKALILASMLIILAWLTFRNRLPNLYMEDGPLEMATALLFLLAGLQVGIRAYFFQTRRNPWYLLIAVLLLFVGFEEISWGQRIFGWTTPEWLSGLNVQGETNFHNLVRNTYLNQIFVLGLGSILILESQLRTKMLSMPSMVQLAQTIPGEKYILMGLIFLILSVNSFQPLGNEVIEEVLALFAFSYSFSVPTPAKN
jgi:hypothetical protein